MHVCLQAHLSMKIFYDIKENLLKWLFSKGREFMWLVFSFLNPERYVITLFISTHFLPPKYCLLKMVRTKLTSVDNFGPIWHTLLKQQHSRGSSLLLAYCFPKERMGSRMVLGHLYHP